MTRIVRRLRRHGAGATVAKLLRDRVFRRSASVILEYRPGWGSPASGDHRPDWLRFVTVRASASLPQLSEWLAPRRADFVAMLAAGKVAVFALRGDTAIGCAWFAFSDHHDARARERYPVAPGEAYHYCWLVDPQFRRSNVTLPMCRFIAHTLAGLGIQRQYGVVDRDNRASYSILSRFGYRECGRKVTHLLLLGTRWTLMSRYHGTLGPSLRVRAE